MHHASALFRFEREPWTRNARCRKFRHVYVTTEVQAVGTGSKRRPPVAVDGIATTFTQLYNAQTGKERDAYERTEKVPTTRLFISTRGENRFVDAAVRICSACPVRSDCLDYALRVGFELEGVFGGMSERQRKRILRDQKAALKAARQVAS